VIAAACTDSPLEPKLSPDEGRRREHVTTYPGTNECDPWMNLNWCEDSGGGECMSSIPDTDGPPGEYDGLQTCPGDSSGKPGGGTAEPPAADTCKTGDPVLDDPVVRQGLKDLWSRSNADSAQAKRVEQSGWIVQRTDGSFAMVALAIRSQSPCGVNGNFAPPPGAVAWVHTHPFTTGEVQTICGALKEPDPSTGGWRDARGPNGQLLYPTYANAPSSPDHAVLLAINRPRERNGLDLITGIIIDADRTTAFTEHASDGTIPFPRCGY
jgi:hypothetical protein